MGEGNGREDSEREEMSRRFGRQQKRKMRAQIAELERANARIQEAYDLNVALTRDFSSKLNEMRGTFNNLEGVLGPYFIGLPPKVVSVREIHDVYQMPELSRAPTKAWDSCDLNDIEAKVYALENTMLKAEYRTMLGCMHVRLRGPAGDFAYSTTREALMRMPKNMLLSRLAQEFALAMANSPDFERAFSRLASDDSALAP